MADFKKEKKLKFVCLTAVVAAVFLVFPTARAAGASFTFSAQTGSYEVGDAIPITVYIQSPGQSINAVSGAISFPSDKLAVTSISQSGSIVNLWVQNPSYSNGAGTANFQGVVLNPGFVGSNGTIITINFKAIAPGVALVSFTSGSILANDGQGTNILDPDGLPSDQYAINVLGTTSNGLTSTPNSANGPLATVISSPTHPDPTKWYSENDAKFVWTVPDGVDAVRLLYNKYSNSTPTVLYQPPISEKELTGLDDGVWYFHIQFHDASGWGNIAHFKFQVDTTPPNPFQIGFVSSADPTDPRPTAILNATDALSGIAYYKIKIDDQNFITVSASQAQSGPYQLPVQASGAHNILVQVFDQAGNYQTAIGQFTVAPIDPPMIVNYTTQFRSGEYLVVKGTTYPNATVTVHLEGSGVLPKSWTGVSDSSGAFTVTGDGAIDAGAYKMYATVTDSRGAQSPPTQQYDVAVAPSTFLGIGNYAISLIAIVISLIIVLLVVGAFLLGPGRVHAIRKGVTLETKTAERDVERAFNSLRQDIKTHVRFLEKVKSMRDLTKEEGMILKQLKDDLERSEKSIESDLEKIEKQLK